MNFAELLRAWQEAEQLAHAAAEQFASQLHQSGPPVSLDDVEELWRIQGEAGASLAYVVAAGWPNQPATPPVLH